MKRKGLKQMMALVMTLVVMMTAAPVYAAENNSIAVASKPGITLAAEPAVTSEGYSVNEELMLYLTNVIRAEYGAAPLTMFPQLQDLAAIRQAELGQSFSHTRPNGQDFSSVLSDAWIIRTSDGENIANGTIDVSEAILQWCYDEEQLDRMINPSFAHVGIGTGEVDGNWVQLYVGGCEATSISVDWDPEMCWLLEKGYAIDEFLLGLNVDCLHGTSYTHITDAMCSSYDPNLVGEVQEITVTYEGHSIKIKVEFYEPMNFDDVNEGDWFYDCVEYVYLNDIMTGLTSGTFGPTQPLYRAQFAVLLYRMQNEPTDFTPIKIFPDVAGGSWYERAILWANSAGIINGYGNGNFGPNDLITREQMAIMMYQYADWLGLDVSANANLNSFYDGANVSSYARTAMAWAVGNGIISGKSNGTMLDPWANATRAECASIVQRFVDWALVQ